MFLLEQIIIIRYVTSALALFKSLQNILLNKIDQQSSKILSELLLLIIVHLNKLIYIQNIL